MGRWVTTSQKLAIPPGFLQELNSELMEGLWYALAAAKHPEVFDGADSPPDLQEVFDTYLAEVTWEDFWQVFPYELRDHGDCLDEIDALGLLLSSSISRSRFERHFEQLATASTGSTSRRRLQQQPAGMPVRVNSSSMNRSSSSRALARAFSGGPAPRFGSSGTAAAAAAAAALEDEDISDADEDARLLDLMLLGQLPGYEEARDELRPVTSLSLTAAAAATAAGPPRRRLSRRSLLPLPPGAPPPVVLQQQQQQQQQQQLLLPAQQRFQQQHVAYVSPAAPGRTTATTRPAINGRARNFSVNRILQDFQEQQQPEQPQRAVQASAGTASQQYSELFELLRQQVGAASSDFLSSALRGVDRRAELPAHNIFAAPAAAAAPPAPAAAAAPAPSAVSAAAAGPGTANVPRRSFTDISHFESAATDANIDAEMDGMQAWLSNLRAARDALAAARAAAGSNAPAADTTAAAPAAAAGTRVTGVMRSGTGDRAPPPTWHRRQVEPGEGSTPAVQQQVGSVQGNRAAVPAVGAAAAAPAAAAEAALTSNAGAGGLPAAAGAAAAGGPHGAAAGVAAGSQQRLTGHSRTWQEACDPEGAAREQQQQQRGEHAAAAAAAASPPPPANAATAAAGGSSSSSRPVSYSRVWRTVHEWLTGEDEDLLVLVSQVVPYSLAGRSLKAEEETMQQLRALARSRPVPPKVVAAVSDRLHHPCSSGEAHLIRLTASSGFSRRAAAAAAVLDCCERHGVLPFYVPLGGVCTEEGVEEAIMQGLFGREHTATQQMQLPPRSSPPRAIAAAAGAAGGAFSIPTAVAAAAGDAVLSDLVARAAPAAAAAAADAVVPTAELTTDDLHALVALTQSAGEAAAQQPAAAAAAAGGPAAAAAVAQGSGQQQASQADLQLLAPPAEEPPLVPDAAEPLQWHQFGDADGMAAFGILSLAGMTAADLLPAGLLPPGFEPAPEDEDMDIRMTPRSPSSQGRSSRSSGEGLDQLAAHLTLLGRCHSRQPMLLLLDEVDAAMTPDDGRSLREVLMQLLCRLPQAVVVMTSSSGVDAWRDAAVLRQVGEPMVQGLYDGRLVLVEHRLPKSNLHPRWQIGLNSFMEV